MKEEDLLNYINNQPNILAREFDKLNNYYKNQKCLRCDGQLIPTLNNENPFNGNLIPNYLGKCINCGTIFNTELKLEIKGPDLNFSQ